MYPELRLRLSKLSPLRRKCTGLLFYNSDGWSNPNFFWLSGAAISGWLWVPFKGKPRMFISRTYREEARKAYAKVEFVKSFEDVLSALPKSGIGADALHMPATAFNRLRGRAKDVSEDLEAARAVKTKYEISQIKHACKLAKEVFQTIELPYRGSEARLRADLEWEIARRAVEPAFPTIVASGKNIATPHHIPTRALASKPLLIDMGVRYNGYCSDTTRTYGSRYQPLIEKVFETIEPLLRPGIKVSDICDVASITLGKYAKYFITGLGHGIGIAVHEDPSIKPNSEDILRVGNVITIEPGIYVTNGIRHENMYLITKRAAENLTNF